MNSGPKIVIHTVEPARSMLRPQGIVWIKNKESERNLQARDTVSAPLAS